MADRHDPRLASFGICVAPVSGVYEHSTSLYHFIYREQDFTVMAPRDPRRFRNIVAIFLDSRFTAVKWQAQGRTLIALRNRAYRRCYLIVLRLVEPVTWTRISRTTPIPLTRRYDGKGCRFQSRFKTLFYRYPIDVYKKCIPLNQLDYGTRMYSIFWHSRVIDHIDLWPTNLNFIKDSRDRRPNRFYRYPSLRL